MPISNAVAAFGTAVQIGDGGGTEVFTTIAELKNITGPGLKLDVAESTQHGSPGAFREKVATLLDVGSVTFSLNFVPTAATQSQSTGLIRDMKNRTKRNFKIVFPDTTTWLFAAFVTGFQPSDPVDGIQTADVELTGTGQPTLAG